MRRVELMKQRHDMKVALRRARNTLIKMDFPEEHDKAENYTKSRFQATMRLNVKKSQMKKRLRRTNFAPYLGNNYMSNRILTNKPFDWFVNTVTGEVIHDPTKVKGDESQLGGNWKHLAKEAEIDPFSYLGTVKLFDNSDLNNPHADLYNLSQSVKIMKANEMVLVPNKMYSRKVSDTTGSQILPGGMSVSIENSSLDEVWLDLAYVSKDFIADGSFKMLNFYGKGMTMTSIGRTNQTWKKPNFFEKIIRFGVKASALNEKRKGSLSAGYSETNVYLGWDNYQGELTSYKGL